MEPEHRQDRTASDRPVPERSAPKTDKTAFTAPFASEGLEQVRGSHC